MSQRKYSDLDDTDVSLQTIRRLALMMKEAADELIAAVDELLRQQRTLGHQGDPIDDGTI